MVVKIYEQVRLFCAPSSAALGGNSSSDLPLSYASWSHGDGDVVVSPGRPVIDGGSRGAVGVATQVAGASGVDVREADMQMHLRMRV